MSAPVLTFNLTRAQLEVVRARLSGQGVELTGDKGEIDHSGVKISYDYTEPTLAVTLNDCGKYPAFMVKHEINNWFKSV